MSEKQEQKNSNLKNEDDLYEIKKFLKRKEIQNDVLKKIMETPDLNLKETKNKK